MEACEVLELIENNLGTGWKGLPLAIQDIIEAAFFVDCSVLPEYAMHRKGGIVERRKNDGYEVLELERGGWIEGIFIKEKPKIEKLKFDSGFTNNDDIDVDEEDDDDDNDKEELDDVKAKTKIKDEDENEENENPSLEDIGEIDIIDDEDEKFKSHSTQYCIKDKRFNGVAKIPLNLFSVYVHYTLQFIYIKTKVLSSYSRKRIATTHTQNKPRQNYIFKQQLSLK